MFLLGSYWRPDPLHLWLCILIVFTLADMGCKADEAEWQELTSNSSDIDLEEGESVSVLSITASHSGFIRCKASNHRGTEVKKELFVVTGNFQNFVIVSFLSIFFPPSKQEDKMFHSD